MKPLSIDEIRRAVGGKILTPIPSTTPRAGVVSTDTRQMKPGCLFIAINGERFNAHEYLRDAADHGALAAIVQEHPKQKLLNFPIIEVKNTRIALGQLAKFARLQLRGKIIAVAGSNGKTSTKYLIDSVLASKFRGSMSPKSFNNDIGVPLTILPADPADDYLVLELGTNHPGEIKTLTEIARPDIAVITNCGAEHLEFLGDLAGVRKENTSIISGMNKKGLLIVNGDDAELLAAVSLFTGKKITFGFESSNDLFAAEVRCDASGTRFKLNGRQEFSVPMLGRHAAANALAAIAVARAMRMNETEIIAALAVARGPDMRLQLEKIGGVSLLNDAYNANPNSMRAALETLSNIPSKRRIAVLGDMRELGETSAKYHQEIGQFAAKCNLDLLVCVGESATLIADAAERGGMAPGTIRKFSDAKSAAKELPRELRDGDLILLKASRGIHLETVAAAIAEKCTCGATATRMGDE